MRTAANLAVVMICWLTLANGDAPANSASAVIDVHAEDLLARPPAANWLPITEIIPAAATAAYRRSTPRMSRSCAFNGYSTRTTRAGWRLLRWW